MVLVTEGPLVTWRYWQVSGDRLLSPHGATADDERATFLPDDGRMVAADAEHGITCTEQPESLADFLAAWDPLFTGMHRRLGTLGTGGRWLDRAAITEGTAYPPLRPTASERDFLGAAAWQLGRMWLPRPLRGAADGVWARYRVPVVISQSGGLDWIAEVLDEPDLDYCAACRGPAPDGDGFCRGSCRTMSVDLFTEHLSVP